MSPCISSFSSVVHLYERMLSILQLLRLPPNLIPLPPQSEAPSHELAAGVAVSTMVGGAGSAGVSLSPHVFLRSWQNCSALVSLSTQSCVHFASRFVLASSHAFLYGMLVSPACS